MIFSLAAVAGWALVGAVAAGVLTTFWDSIRGWLDNVAADFVEKHLGYNARQNMHRAVAVVGKVMDKVRNTSTIYSKKNRLDTYYDKTTIVAEQPVYKVDSEVLQAIEDNKGKLTQEFKYQC